MSHSAIARRYNISEELAEILYTALSIYTGMLRLSDGVQKGHLPGYRYLRCHHTPHARAGRAERIHCANKRKRHCFRKIASRQNTTATAHIPTPFQSLHAHFSTNSKTCTVCQVTKNSFSQLASILHSCGQYINVRMPNQCSFDLINDLDIFGLTHEQFCSRHSSPAAMSSPCRMLPMQVQSR